MLESAVRHGSISAAARELGVTQQAVSSRLRSLERTIGIELIHRSATGVTLTREGEIVLSWSSDLLAAAARLNEAIGSLRGSSARSLKVGASQTIAAHLLPRWMLELRQRSAQPPPEIALHPANSETVIERLRAGELDLGFVEGPTPPHDLGSAIVTRDHMVVAVAPSHPWANRESVQLAELAAVPLIMREEGSGTRASLEHLMRERLGTAPAEPLVTLTTEAAVRQAVARGLAPAVLSELTVSDDVALGRVRAIRVAPAPLFRPFTAIWRGTERDLTGSRRALVALAIELG